MGAVVGRGEGLLGAASVRVGVRVTCGLARPAGGRRRVSEADHLLHGDAVGSVVVHQTVERAEGLVPDAVLPAALQHPEVLHPVTIAATQGSESGGGVGVRARCAKNAARALRVPSHGSAL